jgi:predicted amidohydrolase
LYYNIGMFKYFPIVLVFKTGRYRIGSIYVFESVNRITLLIDIDMKIALASPPIPASIYDGLHWLEKLAEEAALQQAQIICFPESYLPGYPGMPYPAEDRTPEALQKALTSVCGIAKEQGIAIVVPMDWYGDVGLLNLAYVISARGEILGYQTKNQLDPSEDEIWVPGTERQLFEINGLKFGITICHEGFRYPESVRWAAQQGAQLVFHPHFSGSNTEGPQLFEWGHKDNPYYEKAMMMRALENTIYFASCNYASRFSESGTAIINPDGSCLKHEEYGKPGVIVSEIDRSTATGLLARRFRNSLYAILGLLMIIITSCQSNKNNNEPRQNTDSTGTIQQQTSTRIESKQDSTMLIIPGQSIADIGLNVDASAIFQKYGKPDAGDAAMGKATAEWKIAPDTSKYAIAIYTVRDMGNDTTALIKRIRVTSPNYKTKQGLGTTSSLADLQSAFNLKKEKGYKTDRTPVQVYADPSGIAFEINQQQKCIGIVVYEKGSLPPETYFGFVYGAVPLK